MLPGKMTAIEKRAVISLSSIMGLRMVGLFMVLPLFTLYASNLKGATPVLVGLAMGIYGLAQALFQIPFGSLSDRFGRKPIIFTGLCVFILGSFLAGIAHTMTLMIIGRTLQGVGAIGSTVLAMMADLTREEERTKSMAIAGITIGFSFSLAMLLGPLLTKWLPVNGLFFLAMCFGALAMLVLHFIVPTPITQRFHRDTTPELSAFASLLLSKELAKLNIGILILHAIFTASFIVIPLSLHNYLGFAINREWSLYLPTLFAGFLFSLIAIGIAERKRKLKPFFLSGIFILILALLLLWLAKTNLYINAIGLSLFFGGFSLLEAFLPSLISRTAPTTRKGTAMGIFSCSQFMGIFIGGLAGGLLYGKLGFTGVYLFCLALAIFWFALAYLMQPPQYLITQMLRLLPSQHRDWQHMAAKFAAIPGMIETILVRDENMAYLKMERDTAKHPDFIRLKEQLQSE